MNFTNAEVAWLSKRHHGLVEIDFGMRSSCPPHMMQRILEKRAALLGPEFAEFRDQARRPDQPYQHPSLDAEVQASKLF